MDLPELWEAVRGHERPDPGIEGVAGEIRAALGLQPGQLVERRAREQELVPEFDGTEDGIGRAGVESQVLGVQLVPGPPAADVEGHQYALPNQRIDQRRLEVPERPGIDSDELSDFRAA